MSKAREEMERALLALYIVVPAKVADDVAAKARAAVSEHAADLEQLRAAAARYGEEGADLQAHVSQLQADKESLERDNEILAAKLSVATAPPADLGSCPKCGVALQDPGPFVAPEDRRGVALDKHDCTWTEQAIGSAIKALPDKPPPEGWQDVVNARLDMVEAARADIAQLVELRAATARGQQIDVRRYASALGEACDTIERGGKGFLEELDRKRAFHAAWLRLELAAHALNQHVDECAVCGHPDKSCAEGRRFDRECSLAGLGWDAAEEDEAKLHGTWVDRSEP